MVSNAFCSQCLFTGKITLLTVSHYFVILDMLPRFLKNLEPVAVVVMSSCMCAANLQASCWLTS